LQAMQDSLFPEDGLPLPESTPAAGRRAKKQDGAGLAQPGSPVIAQPPTPENIELAAALPPLVHLGTSSWTFPGWKGLVWDGDYSDAQLSKHGLAAYGLHPLFRCVSLDRAFYRPLSALQYASYAAQVGDDFRFSVKAPALVTDATVRGESGRSHQGSPQSGQPNPAFLNSELALQEFVQPALEGLGPKLGALVFQISPLPAALLADMPALLQRLATMLQGLPSREALRQQAPDAVVAVEVRDPQWLTPEFAAVLRAAGATYCLGLHAKMPPIEGQLQMLRALWPGPLVCRWNLHRSHGAYGYKNAVKMYLPFDRLVDEDPETRNTLARVIIATTKAGHPVYATLNNKAEGSAPLSVAALAREIVRGE
jgi:uncharacterized protein YecE (DUF72 family)